MSTDDPYVVVRRAIVDDPRYAVAMEDPAVLGWWLRLRLAADAAWPSSAELPGGCPADVVDALTGPGLVVRYPRDRFRMPEYDVEREERDRAARAGGRARASTAIRDASGQFQPSQASDAGPAPLVQRDRPAPRSSAIQPLNATQLNATEPPPRPRAPATPALDDEPETPVLAFLASVNATVAPTGNGYHRRIVRLVDRRGAGAVVDAMRRLHDADPTLSDRQLIFGAEDALEPTPKTGRATTAVAGVNREQALAAFERG